MADVKVLIDELRARAKYLGSPEPMERVSFSGEEVLTLATALEQMQQANNALMAERTNLIATKREQIDRLMKERDEAREALKPFLQILVYSFEDEPEKIHVTYDGETLAVLEMDSARGTAALKLEQDLATLRALSTKEAAE